jgi:hypothetical protein
MILEPFFRQKFSTKYTQNIGFKKIDSKNIY